MADAVSESFEFDTRVIEWRGPAPFFFAPVPQEVAEEIAAMSKMVSYGWGMIPVLAAIGGVEFTTSLFPRDGGYLLPLKDAVRRKSRTTLGDEIAVSLQVTFALKV